MLCFVENNRAASGDYFRLTSGSKMGIEWGPGTLRFSAGRAGNLPIKEHKINIPLLGGTKIHQTTCIYVCMFCVVHKESPSPLLNH